MNNALKLYATRRPDRVPSTRQQEVTANMSLCARTWRTLTQAQRDGFCALGQTWSPVHGKATASGLTVFQSLNGVRLNSGQTEILTDAPVQPDFIGKLPAFTLNALLPTTSTKLALSDAAPQTATFSLHVVGAPFSGPVVVLATRPLSAGVTRPKPGDFRQIATLPALPALPAGGTDISDAYLTQFPAPAVGMKVSVQMYPISPNGFRGSPFTQTATATPLP